MGDFNEMIYSSEKLWGARHSKWQMKNFRDVLQIALFVIYLYGVLLSLRVEVRVRE